ncbi:pilus assembly protein PilY [Oxalobacteraceae bacterium OM1]|nr:pilus assembly protein PilY [Oxalobacteraceae bacterium OM1]
MKKQFCKGLAIATLLGTPLLTSAEDIDLFVNAGDPTAGDLPNVLIIVDNTANWNQAFTNEMAALSSTLANLPVDKFRVGIMLATETGGGNSNTDGGYVRAAIRQMTATNKTKYQALVNSFDKISDKGNGGKSSLVMAEAYRYFAGGAPYSGNGKVKTDYSGNTSGTTQSNAVYALTGNALASKTATTYASPVTSGGCQKNYIIYISNGPSQDNTSVISQAESMLTTAGGSTTQIPISPSGSQSNVSDEWARFMNKSSLGVVTYTIDVDPVTNGQGPGWTALLKSMSGVSNGKYFSVSSGGGSTQISDALNRTFSEIQAVNSVFAAVSLPVSVNTQGTYLNQVYVGMFRPDSNDLPRWMGNLKQYKMGYTNSTLSLQDADGNSAINGQTGFIAECARSFWTPTTTDSYWSFKPQGTCIPPSGSSTDLAYANSNFPDGNIVEKGAQAYKLRSTTSRTVKTCASSFSSCTSMIDFSSSNVSAADLGAASTTERDAIINWASGRDIDDENINGTTTNEMRPSVHGDVVHSRPVAINYGTDTNKQVVVFYGGNDGFLRAVNGNRDTAINGYAAGMEMWAFAAPEAFSNFKRIRDNSIKVTTPTIAGSPKPYGFDGPVTAYRNGSTTWLFATMRRGGRALYAFDVSTADSPSLKWKIGCPSNFPASGTVSDTGCTSGFTGIGQTWSSAKPFKAAGYGSGASPMVIMGGGYDTCEDSDSNTCTASTKGNKIYVIDASTGSLLKALDTTRSVVGDVTLVRDVTTGMAKYGYAADLGGNLYRITMGTDDPANWTITKIASLGCDTTVACADNRKFMFAPDVVEENGTYIVMVGSGDREKPLSSYTHAYGVTNYFFMVKDKPSDASWLASESGNCESNQLICKASLLGITSSANPTTAQLNGKKGWYLALTAHEQVVTSSVTLYGIVTFSTHQPAVATAGTCGSNLGIANVYNIHYTDASSASGDTRFKHIAGDGLPPSPVAGRVTLDNGTTVPFVIGGSEQSALQAKQGNPGTSDVADQPKTRVYWYAK